MKKTKELMYQTIIKLIFAFLYAVFITLGDFDQVLAWSGVQIAGRLAGWTILVFAVLSVLFMAADSVTGAGTGLRNIVRRKQDGTGTDTVRESRVSRRNGRIYVYFLFAAVCFLCWLPFFLIYFPGWVSNDTVWQLEQACGWAEPSNHHPWMHTMIIKAFFMLGFRIFRTYTGAVATFVAAQMVFMALVYAVVLYDLYIRGVRWLWLALALFFYACLPVNGLYAVCMGKDVLFAGILLLYAREVCRYGFGKAESVTGMEQHAQDGNGMEPRTAGQEKKERYIRLRNWLRDNGNDIRIGILGLLVCMLRSNGILVFAGTAVFMVIAGILRRRWIRITVCTVAVLACYTVYHGPVLRALQVTQPDTIEGLTMPTQHLLSAYLNGGEVTEEERAILEEAVPMEYIASYYNPYYFDIVKEYIRSEGNQQVIADNKGKYLALWARVGLRNPVQYLEAEVRQTCGYWCFDMNEPIYEQYRMAENPFGLTTQRKVFSYDFGLWTDEFLMKFQDFYNKVWSLGLTTWTMLACMAYALYRRKGCLVYLPYVMLFLSLLLATPVHAEFRYTYGMFVALPFLIGITLEKEKPGRVHAGGTDREPDGRNGKITAHKAGAGQSDAEQEEK